MTNLLRRCLYTLFIVVMPALQLMAQKQADPFTAKNAAYLELAGNGIFYSLNYERVIYQKGLFKSAARVGITALPSKIAAETFWSGALPLELVGFIGRSRHHFEFGVGYTPYLYAKSTISPIIAEEEFDAYRVASIVPFRLGYRYQKPEGGLFFRAGYLPALDFTPERINKLHLMHGGISIGKSF